MKPIIRVENLSKRYQLGGDQKPYSTLRESLIETARKPLKMLKRGGASKAKNSFWALKDINFEVQPGEVVGIIGRNGAGKSTLLKVLSRITEPTTGKVELFGRVGSLLEVGTGFHPELTGRENIFLNGAILGMQRNEIERKFDEIVDFAEVEKFLDTPVKHYSSGMYTRLAFAVAANLEPEVLIVDEVLAVGDSEFQKKCLGKMKDVSSHGRTVLFVSHNMIAVKSLCTRGIYLQSGEIVATGDIQSVVDTYVAGESLASRKEINAENQGLTVDYIQFEDNGITGNFDIDKELFINVQLTCDTEFPLINVNLFFNSVEGGLIFATCSTSEKLSVGKHIYQCIIPANTLNDNIYSIDVMVVTNKSSHLHNIKDALTLQGIENKREGAWLGKFPGLIRPLYFDWSKKEVA